MTPRAPAMTPDDRRASIIAATLPLLRDRGRAVSTKEIAKAAGIAEGTIFRVFESKDALLEATVHGAFDNTSLLLELAGVDRGLPLPERLAAAVTLLQEHLRGVFALMTALASSGQPMQPPKHDKEAHRRREEATAELDRAFVDLIGEDADQLRVSPTTFIGYLRMLTLSSVHPMLGGEPTTADDLVDVLLEGARQRPTTRPATRLASQRASRPTSPPASRATSPRTTSTRKKA